MPEDTWNIYTPTVDNVVPLPLRQLVVVQQTLQVPEVPTTGDNTSTDVPVHQNYGEYTDMPNPLLPSDLASAPPTYAQDPEGAQRMLHLPFVTVEDTPASAPFYQRLPYPADVAVDSALSNVTGSSGTFIQARPFHDVHDTATDCYKPDAPANFGHGSHGYIRSSSQSLLPDTHSEADDNEGVPSQTGQAVVDDLPATSGSSHITLSSDNTSSGYRQLVGSPAITQASRARRRGEARQARLYFCEVPGCTSQGFTAKHNLR
ncbi:hypothetical protein AAF712_014604, partial [Marasmius tenuissimus]